MGKISPFEILGETFTNALRRVRLFLPISLAVAFAGAMLNGYFMESMLAETTADAAAFPENFWTAWLVAMFGALTMQIIQLSLFDAIMEQRADWFSFGIVRALRRLLPTLVGMVLFTLAFFVGSILLLIPGVMALFLLYMMLPLILLDDVGPFAALRKSWNLTWGNAWRLFAAIMLTFLPIMIVFWGLAFALGIVSMDSPQQLQPALSLSDWRSWAWVLLTGVIGMFVASFYLVAFRALKSANAEQGETLAEVVTA